MKLSTLLELSASEEAKQKGLHYAGWGKWADNQNKIVAQTVKGKLVFSAQNEYIKKDQNVVKAEEVATYAHKGQQYGLQPYTYHLNKVYQNAVRFGGDSTAQQAAWLHDVLEDTAMTEDELRRIFGEKVAHIVDLVTNQPSKEETLRRIRSNPEAVFVKLCDRLANVEEGEKNDMYRKQQPLFKKMLYRPNEFESLWNELDKKLLP
jgi:guanosine-3',5'-bis(diphosphate) 3'-pyrophosphohydrolase